MKQYKLIKEYPGSPELGSIVNELAIGNIEDYSEFWQEYKEPEATWEVLSFLQVKGSNEFEIGRVFKLLKDGNYSDDPNAKFGYSFKDMMFIGNCYRYGHFIITSVRNKKTGKVISQKQMVYDVKKDEWCIVNRIEWNTTDNRPIFVQETKTVNIHNE